MTKNTKPVSGNKATTGFLVRLKVKLYKTVYENQFNALTTSTYTHLHWYCYING